MEGQKNEGINNLDTDVAKIIREALDSIGEEERKKILGTMEVDEFISSRVDVYLAQHGICTMSGYTEFGAHEEAIKEALSGIE
jgi:hypothetical protein